MKKTILLSIIVFVLFTQRVSAEKATLNYLQMSVDGEIVATDSYLINNENYVALRNIGKLLSNTNSNFSIGYDAESMTVQLETNMPYIGEMVIPFNKMAEAGKSNQKVSLNGNTIPLTGYLIDGTNYFRLRDIGSSLGFYVGYDNSTGTVIIDTGRISKTGFAEKKEKMIRFCTDLVGKATYEEYDCSHLVWTAIQYADIETGCPIWTWTIHESPAMLEIPISEIARGDILNRADRPNQHMMIYLGNGEFVESVPKHGVRIAKPKTDKYKAYRIIEIEP